MVQPLRSLFCPSLASAGPPLFFLPFSFFFGAVICQRGDEDDCRVVNDKDGAKYGSCSRNMVRVSDSSEVLQTAKRIGGALSASVSRSVDLSI